MRPELPFAFGLLGFALAGMGMMIYERGWSAVCMILTMSIFLVLAIVASVFVCAKMGWLK